MTQQDKITILPFYGGAKGQSLQIIEKPDGSVTTNIIKTPPQTETTNFDNDVNPIEWENPPLPTKFDTEDFSDNLRKVQGLAAKIIKLQEKLKETGRLTSSEEAAYKENMETLSESAQKLAESQDVGGSIENREGISAWLENRKTTTSKTKPKKKDGDDQKKKVEEDKKRKAQEEQKKREEEKRKQEEMESQKKKAEKEKENEEENHKGEKEEQEGDSETIGIELPAEDASVAEAKPIGLSVAGVGGVASSKPIATAVVGPGGLAVARPVGTAIAGVDPEQALIPVYAGDYVLGSKPPKNGSSEKANEFLSRIISKFHQI
ncbi:unnamed protein product [Phyllotreta striolata]|uniref:DUF4774 domain-containing protein n=1 Tax=Phyllotreta striolata TaxID=444603 RepID=A0A9N9TK26_PHYSR|nr:unnamed protein product [Phyllotreta striolata]